MDSLIKVLKLKHYFYKCHCWSASKLCAEVFTCEHVPFKTVTYYTYSFFEPCHETRVWRAKDTMLVSQVKTLILREGGNLLYSSVHAIEESSVREIQYFCRMSWVEWLVKPKEGTTDLKNLFPLNVFFSTRPWYHIDIN